jgi:hypothetical protein
MSYPYAGVDPNNSNKAGVTEALPITQGMIDYAKAHAGDFANPFLNFNDIKGAFSFIYDPNNPPTSDQLKEIYDAIVAGEIDKLLYLAFKFVKLGTDVNNYSAAIMDITKSGNTYSITKNATPTSNATVFADIKSFKNVSTFSLLVNNSIVYFCLGMCYEKCLVAKALLAEQVKDIEEINKKIQTNNDFLNKANELYEDYYARASKGLFQSGGLNPSDNKYKVGNTTLPSYATGTCGVASMSSSYTQPVWNSEGGHGTDASDDFSNIDVNEQGALTEISNVQESIRMYGDELSTEAQVLNTKLSQIMQNYNGFLSITTQLAKSTGEYFKSIASNVR